MELLFGVIDEDTRQIPPVFDWKVQVKTVLNRQDPDRDLIRGSV